AAALLPSLRPRRSAATATPGAMPRQSTRSSTQNPRAAVVHLGAPTVGNPHRAIRLTQHCRPRRGNALDRDRECGRNHWRREDTGTGAQGDDLHRPTRSYVAIADAVL